jgi:hypothetical protein
MLSGVLFERQLDAQISFHTGPFHNSRCRLDDLADSNNTGMRDAFQDRLAFRILRPRCFPLDSGPGGPDENLNT